MARRIQLTETELTRLIQRVVNEQTGGVITHPMIQHCKHILNNVPGGSATWKQNMKQAVLGKSCMWVRQRLTHFANKAHNAVHGSGAWARFRAKTMFLECLLAKCH